RGEPIVAHVCSALQGSVSAVLISANRNQERYRRYGVVVADEVDDAGPLSGTATCLKHCRTRYAFVCPGDAPNLDGSLLGRLAAALEETDATAAVAHDGTRAQNLHLLLRSSLQQDMAAYLAAGSRSVRGWLDAVAVINVDCSDLAPSFVDIDKPADLR
ncbi:MAG: molybdenum cofactor guanylyltransferase, partial [Gammaproteobacteria bacterium]|nr:molybdenum cofactor guanylyltransferase [Gammaproteobacteria bacterium]